MPGKYEKSRKKKKFPNLLPLALLPVLILAAALLFIQKQPPVVESEFSTAEATTPTVETTTAPTAAPTTVPTTQPATEPVQVVATATIAAQGDLLMHKPVFLTCKQSDGSYNFESIFRYITEYIQSYDYAVANLETTFGGDDFPYQGNPSFNCPDGLVDSVKAAGYDMLLTANNHSYDTLMTGLNRTLEQVRGGGLATLGTRLSEDEPRYSIVDVNGIKIGMVCYTYTLKMVSGRPSLNDNSPVENPAQINYFSYNNLNKFYSEMEEICAAMASEGAEATMLYIHWGTEYDLEENSTQNQIAQKMCDLGFDVIVGGHPHVVQPMELLTSTTDPGHQTVCIYSLGNAVSNQRRKEMRLNTGHTEDGALFTVTFEKDSTGKVCVTATDVIPTYVNLHTTDGVTEYNILPLDMDREADWMELYDLTEAVCTELHNSYDRTMTILQDSLTQCQTGLPICLDTAAAQ